MVGDQMLIQLVDRQKPQLTLGALAHTATITLLALLVLLLAALLPATAATRDPLRAQQWHLDTVHAEDAWRAGRGQGVVVAVIDTGVDRTHPDLAGQVRAGIDFVDEGTPPSDENGHGTLVAGVIAAVTNNDIGVAGAAPAVQILPVRVLDKDGNGGSDRVARGIRWATDNGAQVINLSLAEVPGLLSGIGGLFGSELVDAIRYADSKGVLVVAAAGNDGRSTTPYPDDLPALVVGATDRNDRLWDKSNRDARTVFAPGVGIISTWKDKGYGEANGTSFATPIVAAAGAILRGTGSSAAQARRRIEESATPVGAGRGRVDLAAAAGVQPAPSNSPTATAAPSPTPSATGSAASPAPSATPTVRPVDPTSGEPLDQQPTPPPQPTSSAGESGEPQPPSDNQGEGEVDGQHDNVDGQASDGGLDVRTQDQQSDARGTVIGVAVLLMIGALFVRAVRRP